MTRAKAMVFLEQVLQKEFKYLHERNKINLYMSHLTFKMESVFSLQMTIEFNEHWMDVLAFISPTPLHKRNYSKAIVAVNHLNNYVKSWGRFYIDSQDDVAYSLRIGYELLEIASKQVIKELECAVDYYVDVFTPLVKVCRGKMSANDFMEFVDNMWGEETWQN